MSMLLVDAHVHIYPCFDPAALFDAALRNFQTQAQRLKSAGDYAGILLLTERQGDHWFDTLAECASEDGSACPGVEDWQVSLTRESESLVLTRGTTEKIVLIAGRQAVSKEGLEVLGLLTTAEFEDGLPASVLIDAVSRSGGIPVVPWACGKWFGTRGKVLQQLVSQPESTFFLGDNGGRPAFLPLPRLLRQAGDEGCKIISGSDPLPFTGEECRVGSFGFCVDVDVDHQRPGTQLRSLMTDTVTSFRSYGELLRFCRFVRNQWLVRRG